MEGYTRKGQGVTRIDMTILRIPHDILLSILDMSCTSYRDMMYAKAVCKKFHHLISILEARTKTHKFRVSPQDFLSFSRYAEYYKSVCYEHVDQRFILLPSHPRQLIFTQCEGKLCFTVLSHKNIRLSGWMYTSRNRSKKRYVEYLAKFGKEATLNLSQFHTLNVELITTN